MQEAPQEKPKRGLVKEDDMVRIPPLPLPTLLAIAAVVQQTEINIDAFRHVTTTPNIVCQASLYASLSVAS